VIVTCERCETEFQLDDARVPTGGARVRCSRCKHAFFVMPPAASTEEAIDRAANLALAADPTPDVTQDLSEPAVADAPAGAAASEPAAAPGEDDESDWEFNGDLPADGGDSSSDLYSVREPDPTPRTALTDPFAGEADVQLELASEGAAAPAPARVAAPAPHRAAAAAASEDLGSPVDWDFLDRGVDRPASVNTAAPVRAISIAADAAGRAPRAETELPIAVRRVAAAAGWIATAALCAVALLRGLAPTAPAATAWTDPAPGLALEDVRGRWLDNASLGRIYVVSGRVHNVAAADAAVPPLVLELRDPAGRAVGDPVPLRSAGGPARLREADEAALAASSAEAVGGLAAGVAWNFEAVVWPLPEDAARFTIRTRS
jgi:predicted Zn finger-like uncharacterized protein